MIKMFNNRKKINLSDLIDINFLQELQDDFSNTLDVASITVDDKGPITKPSNFTNFCTKHIRANELGAQKCNQCDIEGEALAKEKGEPVIYTCHAGLTHFVVPIIVKGKHVASILGGQISSIKPDEKHFKNIAKQLGIEKEHEYIEDLRKIKVIPEKNIKAAVKLLSLVANSISKIAHKNYELIEKNQRETLTEKIIKKIRSTLDAEDVKEYFLEIAQEYFGSDRCIFADYDKTTKKFIPFSREKLKSPDIKSLMGVDLEEVFPEFCAKLKKGKDIIIRDLEKTLSRKSLLGYKAVKTLKESDAKSDYGLLVKCRDEIVGILILHFIKEKNVLSHDEFDFLKIIREHAGAALCQSELYEITKQQAERERILGGINNHIRSSLDLKDIKHEIVNQIGTFLNADRVVVAYYDYKVNNYIVSKEGEYLSSDNVKTLVGIDFAGTPGFAEYIRNIHFQGKDIIFNDLDKYLDENDFRNTGVETFYRDFGFISSAAINMYYEDTFIGDLVVTFENKKKFTDEEIKFLKAIADQAGVAFHQAKLFDEKQRMAENEKFLRQIMLSSVESFNFKEIVNLIVTEAGKYFKADRCFFIKIDQETTTNNPMEIYSEYLSSKNIVSHYLRKPKKEEIEDFIKIGQKRGNDIVNDITKADLPDITKKFLIDELSVKSYLNAPVYYGDINYGGLVLHYVNDFKTFTQEDIYMANAIANQTATVINQLKLYEEQKSTAERESLLRNISETIRSTLDINKTKKSIIETIGKTLKTDRCFITEYDNKKNKFLIVEDEYLSSNNVIEYKGFDSEIEVPHFMEAFKQGKTLFINNKEIFIDSENRDFTIEKKAIEKFNVNSAFSCPLNYKDQFLGVLSTHYIREHYINEDEINLIKTIANQVATAIHQARLYKETQELAKREMLLRNITETVRKSLNFDETKRQIVNIIGETLKADRCFIIEYNKSNDKFLIPNEEYLSSSNILSYKGVDLNEHVPSLFAEFKKGKKLVINKNGSTLNDEKVDFEQEKFEDVRKAIEKYKVYSCLVFPLYYSDEFLGDLVLHYVEVQHEIGEDETNFLSLVSNQIALALYQSKLYQKVQLQAERERISRNIVEILRSTLDKNMIEHLFVRNIGKYFNADRVFFSEFNNKEGKYMPILEQSEYLSSIEEKSFACYDFSNETTSGHIQPLLEKREILIPNWAGYIEKNSKTPELLALYKEANTKSTYSFPVLYEGRIMGYFCIEFTHKINELLDEDINRIRNICTQAGIALYHAELYLEAQQALQSKEELISKVKIGIEKPVDEILKTSRVLSELELERDKQREYLNNIINSCNQLLELTRDISNIKND